MCYCSLCMSDFVMFISRFRFVSSHLSCMICLCHVSFPLAFCHWSCITTNVSCVVYQSACLIAHLSFRKSYSSFAIYNVSCLVSRLGFHIYRVSFLNCLWTLISHVSFHISKSAVVIWCLWFLILGSLQIASNPSNPRNPQKCGKPEESWKATKSNK